MLRFEPVIDRGLNVTFVIQTFTRWHGGVARDVYADAWLAATGPLRAEEDGAIHRLRAALSANDGGCDVIRRLAREDPTLDEPVRGAASVLTPRASRVADDARPALLRWQRLLAGPLPAWCECVRGGIDRFFGAQGAHPLRVYLLPSAAGWTSGNGDMFVEPGATNLDCSGTPEDQPRAVLDTALHEGVHSIYQRQVLDGLVGRVMRTPRGRRAEALRRRSPLRMDLGSYVGELVTHALVPDGALAARCRGESTDAFWLDTLDAGRRLLAGATPGGDVYAAWVMAGAARMVPVVAGYLDQGRIADEALVRAALDIFTSFFAEWSGAGAAEP